MATESLALICLSWFGLPAGLGEESMVVNGVRLLTLGAEPNVDMLAGGAGALNADDIVLAYELADPTPFRISPGGDALSSADGTAESVAWILLSPAGRIEPASSARAYEAPRGLSAARVLVEESGYCDLDFSLSFALSLAARGADGKNCAKLAAGARDIVRQ